ncbi:MAG: amidohydrolase family protein [Acidobacteria bacterium]|nr:amidohydrolase family protein [Acidobacteriota bacterium]
MKRSLLALTLALAALFAYAQDPPDQGHEGDPAPLPEEVAEKQEGEEPKKWDASNPPGPHHTATIDVTEGTWLSLDVSPDGREIVFDLLGDLYTIPIGGGEAANLTSGVEWDMQPRYSPDGRWIAFTSDRSGGDNIWIMKRDGSDPQQVSSETFRLLNSPAWSPDGEFIAARKHFTSRRSLGAGEIWLYHRSGSDGLQMTEKPNEQKDLGEPAFSPDGRYVYYSQDTTPGPVFEYNKNPHEGIYSIKRLDRQTGETITILSGAGGAVRPTPSPDGRSLAFIRRLGMMTTLQVLDLESGQPSILYDGLDRDMQETWAIHGLYPTMAWTPDNRSIVFWSDGKINRIDAASKEVADIPFHVRDERMMTGVVRFPIEVAPEQFPVRMLRWVTVSPDEKRVVYGALGRLWIRDLPNGTPRLLTRDFGTFEAYPSFSRDSRSVVYVSWDDQDLGAIRVVPASGGASRAVTSAPGHYLEPVFSPDASTIVFRRGSGGHLVSPAYSWDTGLYRVSVRGGEPVQITDHGYAPQFGFSGDTLYFMASEGEGKRGLRRIDLDGSDERTLYISEEATEMAISPDGRWLAFTEQFNAWITPFVFTGKTVSIGPRSETVPMTKVSRDAGEYLHWSGDSRTLYWALGPELFSRGLRESFAFFDGAPEELPPLAESGTPIGFMFPYDEPAGMVALRGAKIITMNGDEVIADGTVLVEGNRIRAIGPTASVTVPSSARVVDVSGKTIMPGMIDVHWHGSMGSDEIIPEQNWYLFSSLAYGVTSIHDPSNDTSEIFAASELQKAGALRGPRIFSTGTILYGAKAPFRAIIESLDDARSHLRRLKAVGAFSVKSYNQPRRDQRQQVIEAARELEMMVVPEGGSLFQHNMTMIVDGHTGIEHSIPVANIYDDVRQLWRQSETAYTPTLVVGFGGLFGEEYWYSRTNVYEDERLLRYTPREYVEARARRTIQAADEDFNHFNNARIAAELVDEGVEVQLGAHGQREGLGAHWELWMFHQGGMTNHEALRSATLSGAKYVGLDGDIGSLEPGKLADLIVLDADPLEDIRNSTSVRYTMVNGRLYDAMEIREIGTGDFVPERFWFNRE